MVRQNIYTVTYMLCNIRVLFTLFFPLRKKWVGELSENRNISRIKELGPNKVLIYVGVSLLWFREPSDDLRETEGMFGCKCLYWNNLRELPPLKEPETFSLPASIPQWPSGKILSFQLLMIFNFTFFRSEFDFPPKCLDLAL